jgi:hypothetical protein
MAIVRAPLFSFIAKKSLAQALTYTTWKGLNVVKKWFIPANPNSAAQQAVRGNFLDATQDWESARLDAIDKAAWNLRAARQKTPMSGYNKACGVQIAYLNQVMLFWQIEGMDLTPGVGAITGHFHIEGDADIGDIRLFYGESPTKMNTYVTCSWSVINSWYPVSIAALVGGTKYYLEARHANPIAQTTESGTYTCTPT